jgi:hypothetical protein
MGGMVIIKWILERRGGVVWTGLIWLRTGISGGVLRKMKFRGPYKMLGISGGFSRRAYLHGVMDISSFGTQSSDLPPFPYRRLLYFRSDQNLFTLQITVLTVVTS